MSLLPFFDWCQSTALAQALRASLWAAPVIDILHLLGLAMVFGSVLILNMRLLGLLRSRPIDEVADVLAPWWRRGLSLSAATGVVFFVGSAIKCFNVAPFYVKMAALAMAITFQTTVVWGLAHSGEPSPWRARSAALTSLLLWTLVPVSGFWIELF